MMQLQVVGIDCKIETIFLLLFLTLASATNCQELLPSDSLRNYIIPDSILTKYEKRNHFLEAKNTALGIVLHEPKNTLIEISTNHDTLIELDGFERHQWVIQSIDTVSEDFVMVTCANSISWGEFTAVFTFQKLNSQPICFIINRSIYDEKSVELMSYQKLIIEQVHVKKMVCLREPTPYIPESSIPFLKINFKNISFANKKDFP